MGKSMVSREDFPKKTNPLNGDSLSKWSTDGWVSTYVSWWNQDVFFGLFLQVLDWLSIVSFLDV